MRLRVLLLVLALTAAAAAVLVLGLREPSEPRVVTPGKPLPMNEPVRMIFTDEETGEEDVWTMTKRITSPEERTRPLPEPAAVESREPDDSSRALQSRGLEAWKRGEIREAMQLLEDAIEMDPDDPQPRTHYGRLLALAMDYGPALEQLERAAELDPEDPPVWLDLATTYQKQQRLNEFWEARRRAEALADGKTISQDPVSGFFVIEGVSIYP